ncbi:MAG: NAD(P)/FAD-dependent oxidoreductase [Gammaproteobacteria bacterium]|nr:NAD(P)/FAD-dependent oxidoreductase [Gammaproteobacteria bacterium]
MATDRAAAQAPRSLDMIIVGAGFAGLYMLHKARRMGLDARVLEAGSGAGGTWYWNRYPGARCDIESMQYSYQFDEALEQEWHWSEKYAAQPELLEYVEHVIQRFGLAEAIQYDTRVEAAHFDETANRWRVRASTGEEFSARYCVMATGCLSSANVPHFENKELFQGPIYHTGQWPHEGVDFTGLRVGVIGTGSSAIQAIPIIAEQAAELTVFQRTPAFTVPARNRPLTDEEEAAIKADYPSLRARAKQQILAFDIQFNERRGSEVGAEEIRAECERRWEMGALNWYGAFADLLTDPHTNEIVSDWVRGRIAEIVKDPATAQLLTPKTIFGCKRICADTGYYETFNRANVTLVDVSEKPIEEFTARGLVVDGREYAFDAIVSATGFDAMTGSLNRIDIRGRAGQPLREKWAAGPRTYLGLQAAGFPNLFMISGPGSPSVLTCMMTSIEQHVEFIADVVEHLGSNGLVSIEPTVVAEDQWVEHVNEVAGGTLLNGCNSWYLGANVPGKPRVFMPYVGFPAYAEKCRQIVAAGYEGFALRAA